MKKGILFGIFTFFVLLSPVKSDALSVACTEEYAPVCAQPTGCVNHCADNPYAVCTAICELPQPQTYSNFCYMNLAGAQFLYSGECHSTTPLHPVCPLNMIPPCEPGFIMVSKGVDANGCDIGWKCVPSLSAPCSTYSSNACPLDRCQLQKYGGANWMGLRCIDKNIVKNHQPVITSFTGPTEIYTNETATWSVRAYDSDGDTLTYDIDWGDVPILYDKRMMSVSDALAPSQRTTFEHSYSNPGTYTVRITVRDPHNSSVTSSITVRVKERTIKPPVIISDDCAYWTDGCNTCSRDYIAGPAKCTKMYCIQNTGAQCYSYFTTVPEPLPDPEPYWWGGDGWYFNDWYDYGSNAWDYLYNGVYDYFNDWNWWY